MAVDKNINHTYITVYLFKIYFSCVCIIFNELIKSLGFCCWWRWAM